MSDADQARGALARVWAHPRALGHALGGLCIGAVAGYQFLPAVLSVERVRALGALLGLNLGPEDLFWFFPSLGAAIGVVAGLVEGGISDARAVRRRAALEALAQSRGERFSADVDSELGAKLARDFSLQGAAISHVMRKDSPGAQSLVGELTIATESGSGEDRTTRWTTQTAAYFAANVRFPRFTLRPESTATRLVSPIIVIEDIDFAGHADFSRNYHLSAVRPDSVRRLFDDGLLEHLGRRPGLRIESSSDGLLIYRSGVSLGADEIETFIAEATEIFKLFAASASKLQQDRNAGLVPELDARAEAAKIPGIVGRMVRKRLVTRADVEAFVRQPLPRQVPANIRRYCKDSESGLAIVIGAFFFLAGAFITFTFAMRGPDGGAVLGLVVVVLGGAMVFFFGRIRLRLGRLLRHGQLGVATIENIEPAGDSWRATVRFTTHAGPVQATCTVPVIGVERVRKLFNEKRPAAVLHDPANLQRCLLVDALLTVSPEYDE